MKSFSFLLISFLFSTYSFASDICSQISECKGEVWQLKGSHPDNSWEKVGETMIYQVDKGSLCFSAMSASLAVSFISTGDNVVFIIDPQIAKSLYKDFANENVVLNGRFIIKSQEILSEV